MKSLWIAALPLALIAAPAAAQDAETESDIGQTEDDYAVDQLIIYGEDECPASTGNVIVVCARKDENERYRIPENLRFSDSKATETWTERALSLEVNGPYGQHACSPTGTEGAAGCTAALINAAYEERRTGNAVRFSELIQKAREERLETIDDDAAAMQERVEEIEREYLDRLEREREAELPAEGSAETAPAEPAVVDTATNVAPPPPSGL